MTFKRILFFIAVVIAAATGPVPFLAVLAITYALVYPAYELLVVGVFIDAYYGDGGTPYYLIATGVLVLMVELLRPHIKVRERSV